MNELLSFFDESLDTQGLRKIDATSRMALFQGAVTHYLNGVRVAVLEEEISQDEDVMFMISKLSEDLANADLSMVAAINRLCRVCSLMRSEESLCDVHMKDFKSLRNSECTLCE